MSDEVSFKEGVDIRTLFMRQVERCAISCTEMDPVVFETNVRVLMNMMPTHCVKAVLGNTDYNVKTSKFKYREYCGITQGTKSNPLMREDEREKPIPVKRDEFGDVDWSDPNIISPTLIEKEETDYEELFRRICEVAENAGLTWTIEDYAKVVSVNHKITPTRTPVTGKAGPPVAIE